jgi:mRNA interferase RelE/StbE
MKLRYSPHFVRSYDAVSTQVQKAFDKQVILLLKDIRHPSLRAKKYDEARGIWQARVTREWRFYFTIEGDT